MPNTVTTPPNAIQSPRTKHLVLCSPVSKNADPPNAPAGAGMPRNPVRSLTRQRFHIESSQAPGRRHGHGQGQKLQAAGMAGAHACKNITASTAGVTPLLTASAMLSSCIPMALRFRPTRARSHRASQTADPPSKSRQRQHAPSDAGLGQRPIFEKNARSMCPLTCAHMAK